MKITFRKKTRISNNGFIGGGGGSTLDPSSLKFVPYDESDTNHWNIPDKPVKVKALISEGDIIAKSTRAVVFAASDSTGGSQYLHQLLDVNIKEPTNGDMLIYNASTQMWDNVSEIAIDGGTYSII